MDRIADFEYLEYLLKKDRLRFEDVFTKPFREALEKRCGDIQSHMLLTSNPGGLNHFYNEYFKKETSSVKVFKTIQPIFFVTDYGKGRK